MILLDVEQNTPEWYKAKAGVLSASEIEKIITPTLKYANNKTSKALIRKKALERVTGRFEEGIYTKQMQQGHENEPLALNAYSIITGVTPEQVGIAFKDESRTFGASFDAVVRNESGEIIKTLEVKSNNYSRFMNIALDKELPIEHFFQVQAQMYVSELNSVDYLSFNPEVGLIIVEVEKDESYQEAIANAIEKFEIDIEATLEQLFNAENVYLF